jgi:hypothetical protein
MGCVGPTGRCWVPRVALCAGHAGGEAAWGCKQLLYHQPLDRSCLKRTPGRTTIGRATVTGLQGGRHTSSTHRRQRAASAAAPPK